MRHLKRLLAFTAFMTIAVQPVYPDSKINVVGSAEDTVKQLYHDYAWEAIGLEGVNLIDQPKQELEKYFESSLVNLMLKDNECRKRTQDVCHLDFNIIFASQDPAAVDFEITAINNNSEVKVDFKYPSTREVIKIKYLLIETKSGWRIHDIGYEKGKFTLREKLK